MKKIYFTVISTLLFIGAQAQISYGFDYKQNYESFTDRDAASSITIALYNDNQDSTTRPYSAILSVIDNTTKPSLNAKNKTHFDMPAQQKIEFAPGQKGFRNIINVPIKPIADPVFWGQRVFELNLGTLEGFDVGDLVNGFEYLTIVIDYDGSKIGVPRVNKTMFTIYPNPSSNNIFVAGVACQSIQILDLMGKVVLEQNLPSNQINIETLPAGIYVLNAMSDKGLVVQKIVKQ